MLKNLVPRWYPEKKLIPERYRFSSKYLISFREMARVTGLEPATSGVTGRRSNQLSYTRVSRRMRPAGARGVR